ncbi:alpha/beta fold hydrolase [Streptomyces luteolifulvus]|uniref:Alpha/beta fold hydrolase n=1 Tax=Streptomyces luteolifulvus TaxID=2615112 RepID=A0A6H9URL8_9ACTN|nr:alpha/beta fold hydrolase [Streptomyces luteolifulvus]KAB1141721.1 alpha/beta fold hydrolase [Streptomyces luteolifulvus]
MKTADTIRVAGTSLHVDDTGEESLEPVVCLHSLFLDNRMFDSFVEEATGAFRLIRPDFRGQGRSAGTDRDVVTMEQCAGDIAALLDQLEVSRAQVLVSSMGGDVGVRLAAYRPDLVKSMIFLGSSARSEPADKVDAYMTWIDDVVQNGFTGERLEFVVHVMFGESTRASSRMKETVALWTDRLAQLPPSLRPAMAGVALRGDATGLLPEVRVPTLVISGEECPVRPPEWAEEFASGLPASELMMVPGVGHSPLLERPDLVIPKVLEFLQAQR